jgi:hypothetical protein
LRCIKTEGPLIPWTYYLLTLDFLKIRCYKELNGVSFKTEEDFKGKSGANDMGGSMRKLVFILIAFIAAVVFINAFDHTGIEHRMSPDIPGDIAETNLDLNISN